jgi:anthranilate/para-aminobenzoate synthase component I
LIFNWRFAVFDPNHFWCWRAYNWQFNFQLFTRLTELSPANYSAFLKIDENYIISSSPELFLKAKNNYILSRPIKGTAARDEDLKQDEKNHCSNVRVE